MHARGRNWPPGPRPPAVSIVRWGPQLAPRRRSIDPPRDVRERDGARETRAND
jgi:hypothetical protein